MNLRNTSIILTLASAVCVLGLLAGCNTVKGAGKDIQTVAEKTEKVITSPSTRPSN